MKAMLSPRKREEIKEFWFSTNTSSIDDESKQMIWQHGDTIYYPGRGEGSRLLCLEIHGAKRPLLCQFSLGILCD